MAQFGRFRLQATLASAPASAPASASTPASRPLDLPPLAIYPSKEALTESIQAWAKDHGYAFSISRSKRLENGLKRVYFACDRRATLPLNNQRTRNTQSRGTECPFSILAIELPNYLGWEVKYRLEAQFSTHNHPPSSKPSAHPAHRVLSSTTLARASELFSAGMSNIA